MMQSLHVSKVLCQRLLNPVWQHRPPIPLAFASSHNDFAAVEIDVFFDPAGIDLEDDPIKKQDRAQRLILCRGAHLLMDCEPRQERRDLCCRDRGWVSLVVKEDEPPDPTDVRLLGSPAVVTRANRLADPFEQLGWGWPQETTMPSSGYGSKSPGGR